MKILESASKLILIMFGLVSSIAFLVVVLKNVQSENIVMAVITMYASAMSSVMTYYFSKRANKAEDLGTAKEAV